MTASGHREREGIVDEGMNGFDKIKGTHQSERTGTDQTYRRITYKEPKSENEQNRERQV